MRSTKAKSLRKEVEHYGRRKGFSPEHTKLVYRRVKKGYNNTPRTERNSFTPMVRT